MMIFEDNMIQRRKINEFQKGIMTQANNQFENWLIEQEKLHDRQDKTEF